MLNEMRQYGYSSFRIGNPLKLVIRGGGHIEMSTGGIALVYKAGAITEEKLVQYSGIVTRLAAVVSREIEELTVGTVEALEGVFNDLIEGIVRIGHGGILLIAPSPQRGQFSSVKEVDAPLLQDLLVEYWNAVKRLSERAKPKGGLLQSIADGSVSGPALSVASITGMLEKAIESIASLAGTDGAIVMDTGCRVAAFGAIINRSAEMPAGVVVVDGKGREVEIEQVIKNRGSRHQSALLYTMMVPGSFAFVISQDGGVSAFHNLGSGKVTFELGMRVLD